MEQGKGKYDDQCTRVHQELKAHTVLLIVLGGDKGEGFSITTVDPDTSAISGLLRSVADDIEAGVNNKFN